MRRNKYNVSPADQRTYNGRVYASKAEMEWARDYAGPLLRSTQWTELVEQPSLWLGVPENKYRPDFLVIEGMNPNYPAFYVDVKGVETAGFRRIKKLWAVYGRLPLHIVKKLRGGFETTEIIIPHSRAVGRDSDGI